MPYFRFVASTPYCGEEITEHHEVDVEEVDTFCTELANNVADMYWDGDEKDEDGNWSDGCYTQDEYYGECSCSATELTKEEYLDEGGVLNN